MSDDNLEIRVVYYFGLMIPNPSEFYRNTRSYEDMRMEYDLLNCAKITDEELEMYSLKFLRTQTRGYKKE